MKILSLLMVLVMLLSFAACNQTPVDPVDSGSGDAADDTTPAETTADPLADNLPAETFDGEEIHIWIDGTDKYYGMDLETEYIEGDVMHDAIVARNDTVADRFDVTWKFNRDLTVGWRNQADLRQSILGGDEYDIIEGVSLYQCPLAVYGCYIDLADNEYIDFSKPWWQEYATASLNIAGRQYNASGYYDFTTLQRAHVFYFNANLVEDYELGNLYDLVDAGDWTFDKMLELGEKVAEDVNQDGVYDENDMYGIGGRWDAWFTEAATAGYRYVTASDDGSLVLTGLTEDLLEIHEKIYPLITNNKMYWSGYTYRVHANYQAAASADAAKKAMFCNDQMLFMLEGVGMTSSQQMRDFGAYGILPSPKYVEGQEVYGCVTTPFCSAICTTSGDYGISSIILEALQAETYKQVRPVFFETALSYKYLNDPKAMDMLDLAFGNITCEFMYNYSQAGITNLQVGLSTQENLASYFETNKSSVEAQLVQFMEQIAAIPE